MVVPGLSGFVRPADIAASSVVEGMFSAGIGFADTCVVDTGTIVVY